MSSKNPFLFVVGCPRSGTTLLQRMLDAHPLLAVANDTHFIPRALEKAGQNGCKNSVVRARPLTPGLVNAVKTYHRFPRLGLDDAAVDEAARTADTYSDFVSALYREYARMGGKALAGEKTPDYVRHLPLLHSLFPWVRSVHILRDGRDVALSILEWAGPDKGPGKLPLWGEEPVAVCALWWRWQVETGQRDARTLVPDHYFELKYERLVEKPTHTLRSVMDFLQLPFAEEMLAFNRGKLRHQPGLSAKKAWLPPTSGLRDWRTQMDERSIQLFEALAGDLLSGLGYQLGFKTISPKLAATAQRCQAKWNEEMGKRRRPLIRSNESRRPAQVEI